MLYLLLRHFLDYIMEVKPLCIPTDNRYKRDFCEFLIPEKG